MKKRILFALLVLVIGSLIVLWQISRSRTFQFFGELVPRVNTSQKVVALTFDDGPTKQGTSEILAILDQYQVSATFFLIGAELEQNMEQGRRIVAAGHELGNHSYSHERMLVVTPSLSTATTHIQRDARARVVEEHLRAENDHDVDAIMATFCEKPRFQLNATHLSDTESIRAMYTGFGFGEQGSFSNVKAEMTKQHVAEESIITELILRGKHTDTWQGIPATDREFSFPLIAIFEFDKEGKLASERVYFDGALMMQQLGLL